MSRSRCVVWACLVVAAAAAGPTWQILNSNLDVTTMVGIGFDSATLGYVAGDANGIGPAILKTTNGGLEWNPCNVSSFGLDILLLDLDATEQSIVVSSIFGELYSDDGGDNFYQSTGGGQSQSVRFFGVNGDGGEKYGCAGYYNGFEGVAISVDGGKTFTAYNAQLGTEARYGAYNDKIWWVAAGEWPNKQKTDRRRSHAMLPNGHFPRKWEGVPKPLTVGKGNGYIAEIAKSTDAGKTWTKVFNSTDQFYFNAIDCHPTDFTTCCAVGEGFSDGTNPGARIYCTNDAGSTWQRNFWMPATSSTAYSLMEIKFVSSTEVWAVGSQMNAFEPVAWFLHSTDAGKTWALGGAPMNGYAALGLSMVDSTHGFAALDNTITQASEVAAYK